MLDVHNTRRTRLARLVARAAGLLLLRHMRAQHPRRHAPQPLALQPVAQHRRQPRGRRFRRGLGGTLSPAHDAQTSNVPFYALATGAQGAGAWAALLDEAKGLNAGLAVLLAVAVAAKR